MVARVETMEPREDQRWVWQWLTGDMAKGSSDLVGIDLIDGVGA